MDQDTKDILNPLIRSLADIAETQGLILELLAKQLSIPDGERQQLLLQGQARRKSAETWRQLLKTWK